MTNEKRGKNYWNCKLTLSELIPVPITSDCSSNNANLPIMQPTYIAVLVLVQHKQLTSMVVFLLAQLYQVQVAMLTL